jgi:hypothetical protein
MSQSVSNSRRSVVKALASIPLLPLTASFARTAEARLGETFGQGLPVRYTFGSMAAPSLADPGKMATTYVASTVTKRRAHGPARTYALAYEAFFLTGKEVPMTGGGTIVAGGYYDISGQPILDTASPDQRQFFSDCPDGMSLIQLDGVRSKRAGCHRIFAVVQFEYATKDVAGCQPREQLLVGLQRRH